MSEWTDWITPHFGFNGENDRNARKPILRWGSYVRKEGRTPFINYELKFGEHILSGIGKRYTSGYRLDKKIPDTWLDVEDPANWEMLQIRFQFLEEETALTEAVWPSASDGENQEPNDVVVYTVYVIMFWDSTIKVGLSGAMDKRPSQIEHASGKEILHTYPIPCLDKAAAKRIEDKTLEAFKHWRKKGEYLEDLPYNLVIKTAVSIAGQLMLGN